MDNPSALNPGMDEKPKWEFVEGPQWEAPSWATDPASLLPLGFEPATRDRPERFFLGVPPNRAFVLLRAGWRSGGTESLVVLACGAWKALVGSDCDRTTAAMIAQRWAQLAEKPSKPEFRLLNGRQK
jgi:hypothetical protein